jgi:hypothetical protein
MALPTGGEIHLAGSLTAASLLVSRLAALRAVGRYPIVASCVVVGALRMASGLYLARSQVRLFGLDGYGLQYVVTQPILWALYFLVILELFSITLEEYPGVRRLGRVTLFSVLGAIALACASLILVDRRAGVDPYPFLGFLALQERSVFIALSAVTLLLLLFIGHYRLPVRRNVLVLWTCFGGYFLLSAGLLTLRWYFGASFAPVRNLSNAVFYIVALLGASVFLSRAGETEKRPMSSLWGDRNREAERALSLRLQDFNNALVKVLRQ